MSGIWARIGRKGQTIGGGHDRVGEQHVVGTKEGLQYCDAGTSHRGMTRTVAWMRRRAFRKRVRQEVGSAFCKDFRHSLRMKDIGMQRIAGRGSLGIVHKATISFRPQRAMHPEPLE